MKVYVGRRIGTEGKVSVDDGTRSRLLDLHTELGVPEGVSSSRDANWGFDGSGPRRLAFAILADYTGRDQVAKDLMRKFSMEVLAGLDHDGFELTGVKIDEWLEQAVASAA